MSLNLNRKLDKAYLFLLKSLAPALVPALRVYWAKRLRLPEAPSSRELSVTPLIRIKNEDIWIETILRTLGKVFPHTVVIDNGSQDKTISILKALKAEGLPFDYYQYCDPLRNDNVIRNLILDRLICTQWFYMVDGDELQFEDCCREIKKICEVTTAENSLRMVTNVQFFHPENIRLITQPHCPQVRHTQGRIFYTEEIHFPRVGWRDYPLHPIHMELQPKTDTYCLIDDAFFYHAVVTQRSSIKTWEGWKALDPLHNRQCYIAQSDGYEPLKFFPKEFLECRYNDHNPYRATLLSLPGVKFI